MQPVVLNKCEGDKAPSRAILDVYLEQRADFRAGKESGLELSRREILKRTSAGLIVVTTAQGQLWATPADAAASAAPFQVLAASEAAWLAGLGEAIAPPSRDAGLVHYVDHHLALPHADCLLALRYLDVLPPYADFYRPALSSLQRLFGDPPPLNDARWGAVLDSLAKPPVAGWQGPPPQLFGFAVRLDAIDIAYGTRAGFARLGVDYLAHIEPERDW